MTAVKEKNILVGIAYNAYDPLTARKQERASEESVEQTAKEVLTAVTELGYMAFILPLHKSFMSFLNRLKDLNADAIINHRLGRKAKDGLEITIAAFCREPT